MFAQKIEANAPRTRLGNVAFVTFMTDVVGIIVSPELSPGSFRALNRNTTDLERGVAQRVLEEEGKPVP
jgi:hypothetical protein